MLSLRYFPLGIASYLLVHALHMLWWRFARPRREFIALFSLLVLFPIGTYLCVGVYCQSWGDLTVPALSHFALAGSYLAVFPAFQASSPTLRLVARLQAAPTGVSEKTLQAEIERVSSREHRLSDLVNGGLVNQGEESKLSLNRSGRRLVVFFEIYRKTLGVPEGKG